MASSVKAVLTETEIDSWITGQELYAKHLRSCVITGAADGDEHNADPVNTLRDIFRVARVEIPKSG